MAATGFTPISTYYTTTASAVPTTGNLVNGELALNINTADGKLFYKDSAGVVQVLATRDTTSGSFVNLAYTGTLTGGTGVVNLGSGQFYKDASGNVGIGTSSPGAKLNVLGTTGFVGAGYYQTAGGAGVYGTNLNYYSGGGDLSMVIGNSGSGYFYQSVTSNHALAFGTNNTERMRVDSSGNLLLGGTSNSANARFISENSANANQIGFRYTGVGTYYWGCDSSGNAILNKDGAERMRIDSSGNFFVNATGFDGDRPNAIGIAVLPVGDIKIRVSTDTQPALQFYSPTGGGTAVGSVNAGTASTSYNTSSDYRLKDNIAPMTGALNVIQQLKPVTYNWKSDGSKGQGFIAHELQAVVSDCVTGEKDAVETVDDVDAEGKVIGTKEVPRYQGIDTSFLVATLTAAIQEQQALITDLTTRLSALESK